MVYRRWWLAAVLATALHAQQLVVRPEAGGLRVAPARIQFLEGRSLDRLHGGAPVIFAVQLTLLNGSRSAVLARSAGRFAVSFDIWEEKFAVTHLAGASRSASHLSSLETEAWCLNSLALASAGLSPDAAFWVRLDVRAEELSQGPAPVEEPGVTLARLVDLFSRPRRQEEARKRTDAGPFHLKDLR